MHRSYVVSTPLGKLVTAFIENVPATAEIQLIRLTMLAARCSLPCWELYCDTKEPHETIAAVERWLLDHETCDWSRYTTPAVATENGVPIVDCRQCDTSSVANAAAEMIKYIESRDLIFAICSLSSADTAFDQSPLSSNFDFRKWLVDTAIPAAYFQTDLAPPL